MPDIAQFTLEVHFTRSFRIRYRIALGVLAIAAVLCRWLLGGTWDVEESHE